jgi:hypothetical protein
MLVMSDADRDTARAMLEELKNDPKFRYDTGVVNSGYLAEFVAFKMGHSEWSSDERHWIRTLASEVAHPSGE